MDHEMMTDKEKLMYWEKNMPQCNCVYHILDTDYPGNDPKLMQ
jgi:hypothetical protein